MVAEVEAALQEAAVAEEAEEAVAVGKGTNEHAILDQYFEACFSTNMIIMTAQIPTT